jgi:lysophospholipase L1-like esterase
MAASLVRRRRSAFAAGLATLAMTLSLAATPAQAGEKIHYYVALGDSYAAGQGAGPYLDGCFRSDNAYSELADALKTVKVVTNVACSGRTTQGVVKEQLGQLNRKTDLVTITAGGNNLGFGELVGYCGALALGAAPDATLYAQACALASAYAEAQLTSGQLYADLASMIQSVHAAAPNAKIVVTGYPYLFDPIGPGRTDALAQFIYQATDLANNLNGTIAIAAGNAKAIGRIDVEFVGVTTAFAGHGVLTTDPWINLGGATADNFHPNAEGYQAYFTTLRSAGVYK